MRLFKKYNQINLERINRVEFIIFLCMIALLLIGYFALKSATLNTHRELLPQRQFIWIITGIIVFFISSIIPERFLINSIKYIYFIIIFLLLLVPFVGETIYGAKRWINLGPFGFQPSEFYKIALILMLSYIFSRKKSILYYFVTITVFISSYLVFKQPDFGTTIIIIFIWFVGTFISEKYDLIFKISTLLFILVSPLLLYFMQDYQRTRILSFIFPETSSPDASYNVTQSIRAISSGGLLGTGYMNGPMNLGQFVPENHTDFIISVIGEEFGFIGMSTVIILYFLLIWRLFKGYLLSYDNFWKYFYFLSSILISFHVFENIGMNLGIMPVTGIPLPFITYGGSPTISFCILLGLATKGLMTNKNIKI